MPSNTEIEFTLNGRPTQVSVSVSSSALTMLRETFDLTGTKLACGEGECGACTIIVDGMSVNSCIMFAADCDGREITTIEGLQDDLGLDPVQRAFADLGSVQCGFCTPGMIMQARNFLDRNPNPNTEAIRRGLEGNICRCTGYSKIIEAVQSAGRS